MEGAAVSAFARVELLLANQNAVRSGPITKDAERLSNDNERIESRARGASEVFSTPFSEISIVTKQ